MSIVGLLLALMLAMGGSNSSAVHPGSTWETVLRDDRRPPVVATTWGAIKTGRWERPPKNDGGSA